MLYINVSSPPRRKVYTRRIKKNEKPLILISLFMYRAETSSNDFYEIYKAGRIHSLENYHRKSYCEQSSVILVHNTNGARL